MYGYSNYDKFPCLKTGKNAFCGYDEINAHIKENDCKYVVVDCYPIVDSQEITNALKSQFDLIINTDKCAYEGDALTQKMQKFLTDDRIFGLMITDNLNDYFIPEKIQEAREKISKCDGRVLVIGVGALLVWDKGLIIHASIARWESQMRFRKGVPNWNCDNYNQDPLTKFKRGYFAEWRLADKHKNNFFDKIDWFIDTNEKNCPKMISKRDYEFALEKAVNTPFRVVPYFDPGVWGGQWMKEVCSLDKDSVNFAWCFDCVPEENSMLYDFCGVKVEMPSVDIVFRKAKKLLGERVQARFGNEFPIRFDFLDTMQGGNLSLQVHPTTEYIQGEFNMRYTQDESYYILDCGENSSVYLGVKENCNKQEFIQALQSAQETGQMDVEKYVNRWTAKKHDHFLIPAGTIHCSGSNAMVLEISSTPYIFTFKLWDWGRVGLDGKPRPINIKHGANVIAFERDTKWVANNLINQIKIVEQNQNYVEEKTGLHEREFIETRRHRFTAEVLHKYNGSVNVFNLVEGEEAEVVSPTGMFEPFVVHYAETFIVPANVGDFIIRPKQKTVGQELATIKAYVRG